MHFNTSLARDILRTEHLGDDDDDTKHLKGHTYTTGKFINSTAW